MSSAALQRSTKKLGPFDCVVIDTPRTTDRYRALVVLCHGFGAPGDDLVPCAAELYGACSNLSDVRFIFPAGPIELDASGLYDSRAWWPIDMVRLQEMIQRGELRDLRSDRPELLDQRYQQLTELIAACSEETSVPVSRMVLGGFSQGAMLATETALRMPQPPAGLVVWSGTLLNERQWRELAAKRGELQVVQTHGRIDPILPFAGGVLLHELFTDNNFDATFFPFLGPHTISREGIAQAARLIEHAASAESADE